MTGDGIGMGDAVLEKWRVGAAYQAAVDHGLAE